MSDIKIYHADSREAKEIEDVFPGIALLKEEKNKRIVIDGYCTALKNTSFQSLRDVPFSRTARNKGYYFYKHINEVVNFSLVLYRQALKEWQDSWVKGITEEQVILFALLHDLDKVILLDEGNEKKGLDQRFAHGFLGAMILSRLGLEDRLVALISDHSPTAPIHAVDSLAMILHYADLFSADHINTMVGKLPFYCKGNNNTALD